jgi:hypothetical protein
MPRIITAVGDYVESEKGRAKSTEKCEDRGKRGEHRGHRAR